MPGVPECRWCQRRDLAPNAGSAGYQRQHRSSTDPSAGHNAVSEPTYSMSFANTSRYGVPRTPLLPGLPGLPPLPGLPGLPMFPR